MNTIKEDTKTLKQARQQLKQQGWTVTRRRAAKVKTVPRSTLHGLAMAFGGKPLGKWQELS